MWNKLVIHIISALLLGGSLPAFVLAAESAVTSNREKETQLRTIIVDYMRKAATVEWTPIQDIPYWNPEHNFAFKKGEKYFGLPYTQYSRNNDLSSFESQLETIDGIQYYTGPSEYNTYRGSDCSASVSNAWKQADPSFPSLLTRRLIPDRPKEVVPVGKYQLNFYDSTPNIVQENGMKIMSAAYAQLKPGDAVVTHYDYDGHIMLVLKNDPENNRLFIADQTGLDNGVPKGKDGRSTFRIDYEYSYDNLFKNGYIPIALQLVDDATHEIELFNGKNLEGWDVWIKGAGGPNIDPESVFSVKDGSIRVSGSEFGGLQTKESYSNYRLTVEFKWGKETYGSKKDKARDSGVLIHSFGELGAYAGVWSKSVEANIIEGGVGDFWIVGDENDGIAGTCDVIEVDGKKFFNSQNGTPVQITSNSQGNFLRLSHSPDWQDVKGFKDPTNLEKADDWNELVIYAVNDEMRVFLNGKFVNRIYNLQPKEGRIQLQSEGAEIFFRRVSLRPWDEPLD